MRARAAMRDHASSSSALARGPARPRRASGCRLLAALTASALIGWASCAQAQVETLAQGRLIKAGDLEGQGIAALFLCDSTGARRLLIASKQPLENLYARAVGDAAAQIRITHGEDERVLALSPSPAAAALGPGTLAYEATADASDLSAVDAMFRRGGLLTLGSGVVDASALDAALARQDALCRY